MANINKIKLSGTTYEIQDLNATKTVELTQAEYDALSQKDPNVFYIITDAQGADLSNYYTKTEADDLLDTKLDVTAYTPTDLSNYYTKSETSGATEISTALESKADTATTYTKTETDNAITAATSTKQDALVSGTNIKTINNQSILGEGNITIEGGSGGGKAIEAGRGISITTGETADTVSINLPISAGTGTNSIIEGNFTSAMSYSDHAEGSNTTASGECSHAEGLGSVASSYCSHAEGFQTTASSVSNVSGIDTYYGYQVRHAEGYSTLANNASTHTEGYLTIANNFGEHASGVYNNSTSASTTFGDSGNTLFSVGNGTPSSARHNAFEIRQNGDIYIADTNDTSTTNYYEKPMIKLQDALVGGGGSITIDPSLDSGSTNAVANSAITNAINDRATKGQAYGSMTFGSSSGKEYVRFEKVNGTRDSERFISKINGYTVWGTTNVNACKDWELVETSAITTSVTSSSTDAQVPSAKAVYDQFGGLKLVKLTQSEYDSLTTKDNSTLYVIVN